MAEKGSHGQSEDAFDGAPDYEELAARRVQDPVEAEHMAHAMDPHYTHASKMEQLADETEEIVARQEEQEEESAIPLEQVESDEGQRRIAEDEDFSNMSRSGASHYATELLHGAAGVTREAGDKAGEIASSVYRRKQNEDPPSAAEARGNDQR